MFKFYHTKNEHLMNKIWQNIGSKNWDKMTY
ncbi:hypothetical protein M948_09880 [Virgibacillus sp. CM-4]|nr:hypothetical protein M948_09880 [Virgibacillus sp. CM-4]